MKNIYINDYKEVLRKENLKFTDQRYTIFKFLFNNNGHYDCDQIIKKINVKGIEVSRATAYRTLDILVKYNFARKLTLDDGIVFEWDSPYWAEGDGGEFIDDVVICVDSGKIMEFESPRIEKIQDEIAKSKGYKIIKHVHQLLVKKIK